jgi:hypothetical protein
MLDFPIASREMRIAARSAGFYRARLAASATVLVIGILFGTLYHYFGFTRIASIFGVFSFFAIQICLFWGIRVTSDCLSREKREGTIGLLFLTPLKPYEITLGKLIANGLPVVYSLILFLPLASIWTLAGGVRLGDLAILTASALNFLFVSMAIGLFASSWQTERRKAAGWSVWIILGFWMGIPALASVLNHYGCPSILLEILGLFGFPAWYGASFGPGSRAALPITGLIPPWAPLLTMHLVGWMFVGWATLMLKRTWQEHPPRKKFKLREWWSGVCYGSGERRRWRRVKLINKNAFLWLASRNRLAPFRGWLTILILITFIGFASHMMGLIGQLLCVTLALSFMLKVLLASNVGLQISRENEQGTLEMLLSTPLQTGEIISGQQQAAWRPIRVPTLIVMVSLLVLAIVMAFDPPFRVGPTLVPAVLTAAYLVISALDLWTLSWLGIWTVTVVKDPRRAAGSAIARCIFVPIIILAALSVAWGLLNWYFEVGWSPDWRIFALGWFALSFTNDMVWLRIVRQELPAQLRSFSLRKYSQEEPLSLIARAVVVVLRLIFPSGKRRRTALRAVGEKAL